METLQDLIIKEARTWIGTPWQHNQKCKGYGVDCVQLAIVSCQAAGVPFGNPENYYRRPRGNSLFDILNALPNTDLIEADYRNLELKKGQLLLFKIGGVPHHVGFATGNDTFIHADQKSNQVIEQTLGAWRRKLAGVFDIIA